MRRADASLTENDVLPMIFAEGFTASRRLPLEEEAASLGGRVLLVWV